MAKVLIVDDDEQARLLERHILESAGHEPFFAKNGAEAMRLFMRKTPDVVVTDLQMPGGDGIELIEALVGMFPDVHLEVACRRDDTVERGHVASVGVFDSIDRYATPAPTVVRKPSRKGPKATCGNALRSACRSSQRRCRESRSGYVVGNSPTRAVNIPSVG